MDKFLKISTTKLLTLRLTLDKIENPVPILWNMEGFYGWIPVEIIKNELDRIHNSEQICPGLVDKIATFTWQQTYPLRADVGKILEEMNNRN